MSDGDGLVRSSSDEIAPASPTSIGLNMGRSDQPEGASAEDGGRSEPQMVMSPMNPPTRERAATIVDADSAAVKKASFA
jgi:hypothetical protein